MEKSEAAGGANPTILEAVNLTGPRQSSSGHKTKVSMIATLCLYGFMVCDQLVVAKVAVASHQILLPLHLTHVWFVFTSRAPTFLDPPMERLIAVTGDERRVEVLPQR